MDGMEKNISLSWNVICLSYFEMWHFVLAQTMVAHSITTVTNLCNAVVSKQEVMHLTVPLLYL